MIYLNGCPLSITTFPDNTSQVWKMPDQTFESEFDLELKAPKADVKWDFSTEVEVMHLAQLKTLLDSKGIHADLFIKYLPYARQDKDVSNTATFGLHTFATILNAMNFENVYIMDPHSKIALDLIKNSTAAYPVQQVMEIFFEEEIDLVCYPDKGALSKYAELYQVPHIYGEKVRDQSTGNITSYEVFGECKDKNILIVDDICDGGATFKILATDLLAKGASKVVLFVSHGIFSKGTRTLFESGISKVFTKEGEISKRHGSTQI